MTSIRVGVAWSTRIRDSSRSNLPSFAAEQANSQIMQPVHLSRSHCMWRRSMPVSLHHFLNVVHPQCLQLLCWDQSVCSPAPGPIVLVNRGLQVLLRHNGPGCLPGVYGVSE